MGADELAAALHAPLRSELSSLWGDDDAAAAAAVAVSPSSSSSSGASSPALPPQQQQPPPLAPSFFFPVSDLSAFLTTAAPHPHQPPPMATTPNFLDDLLSSTDELDFRVRGGAAATTSATSGAAATSSSSSSSVFALTHSLPPSIQQQLVQSLQAQRQLATGLGSLGDFELDGAADPAQLAAGLRGATASRLLQLENNYERKKKRAKINRKDLNARFQELMDILNLKEDRKLNRAKILEKAIEYIERLEDELHAVRSQAEAKKAAASASTAPAGLHHQQRQQQAAAAQLLLHSAGSSAHAIGGSGSLVAFNTSGAHAWAAAAAAAAAGASSIPMAPMMWLPCPVVAPTAAAAPQPAARVRTEKRGALQAASKSSKATGAPAAMASGGSATALPVASEAPPTAADGLRRSLKRTREGCAVAVADAKREDSVFVWGAQEIPTLLAFCDAWTLASLMQTSKEVAAVARQDKLWLELSRQRWWLGEASTPCAREQWMTWHREMRMPACGGAISPSSTRFAAGRARAVDVWGLLARRSNGRTTRTVLVGGKAAVMQVVELSVVVQNMGQDAVRLSGEIRVGLAATSAAGGVATLAPFTAASGAHLTPHVVSLNGGACVTRALESVVLRHGDVCVLAVFLECPGLDLEQEFLQRAEWLDVRCAAAAKDEARAVVVRCAAATDASRKP